MSTINLEYGNNYHVFKTHSGYKLTYANNNKTFSQEIANGKLKKAVIVGYYDETLPLVDGCVLKRNREILSIEQE